MRKIITTTFMTLDGVIQAPGGPEEDTAGGFSSGGWTVHYWDEKMGEVITGFMNMPFELLLGRKTYDIFAAYWPNAKTDMEVAKPFNATKKYVVSHKLFEPKWKNSTCITGDVVSEIKKLKESEGLDLWVWGSSNLIQTLLKNHLIDRMYIWIYPVTIGKGKKLFAEGTQPEGFKLVEAKPCSSGVIIATYEPAGELKPGTVGQSEQ
ncbi:MAG: dihydrofolate reductase [Candidatus Micrarchaeota archaeon]|nr:dihydrofolate reductase [Candidatus Micrarchaeota archaeon]